MLRSLRLCDSCDSKNSYRKKYFNFISLSCNHCDCAIHATLKILGQKKIFSISVNTNPAIIATVRLLRFLNIVRDKNCVLTDIWNIFLYKNFWSRRNRTVATIAQSCMIDIEPAILETVRLLRLWKLLDKNKKVYF